MTVLLLALLSFSGALAAPIPDDTNADIVATGHVAAEPMAVWEVVSDLTRQEKLLSGCTKNWQHGEKHQGIGASAALIYTVKGWRRKLTATISKAEPGVRVLVDHAGNKGFITTWTLSPDGTGTQVELRTLLNLAPRPFRKIYVNRIQPEWQACYATALGELATELGG